MGEIGRDRREFLNDMRWWEIRSIIRGYNRRSRDIWSATRWQTFNLMSTSMADIKSAGIHKPTDLITFPWERQAQLAELPTEEEAADLVDMMRDLNSKPPT